MNEVTPDGTKTFNQSGSQKLFDPYTKQTYDIPTFSVTQTLSPQQQAIKAQQDRADLNLSTLGADQSARIGKLLGQDINVSGLPQIGAVPSAGLMGGSIADAGPLTRGIVNAGDVTRSYNGDFSADRQRVEGALMSRMNPQLERDREALRTSLANQGIREGSVAFDRAMNRLGEQSNDARMQAILAGGQEQSRMVGLEAQRAAFENAAQQQIFGQHAAEAAFWNDAQNQQFAQNQAKLDAKNAATQQNFQNDLTGWNAQGQMRDRALQEAFALRNQPLNEIAALMSGSQVSMPQFMTGAQVQPMPITDNAAIMQNDYANRLGAWQSKQAALGGLFSGVGGLFGGIGAMRG